VPHTVCGRIGDLQREHDALVGFDVLSHCALRRRVLERDSFRFGTAIVVPFRGLAPHRGPLKVVV
jgi:hypothetical protein